MSQRVVGELNSSIETGLVAGLDKSTMPPTASPSSKRRRLAVLSGNAELQTFLKDCTELSDERVFKILDHGAHLPNVDAVISLLQLLKKTSMAEYVNFDQLDQIMEDLQSICGTGATPSSVRQWQEVVRVWERTEAARVVGERERIHLCASAVSASLAAGIADRHGILGHTVKRLGKLVYTDATAEIEHEDEDEGDKEDVAENEAENEAEEVFNLDSLALCDLSWTCAVAGRYVPLSAPRGTVFDPLMCARILSNRKGAQDQNSIAMCTWRMEQDAQVVTIDEVARPAVYALLDQFAVVSGAAAAKQGSSKSRYILAHGGVKPSERWRNVWEVAYRTLQKVDAAYKLGLAPAALKAWKGDGSIDGNASVKSYGLATTKLFLARRFPLQLLSDELLPPELTGAVILIWPCPRWWWSVYFCTPIMFSALDSLFCGYVRAEGKASQNHLIDDGSRADPNEVMMPTPPAGDNFYHSESQPMHGDAVEDVEDPVMLSTWNEARLRSKILISTRKRLLEERGAFMEWLRMHIEGQFRKVIAARREQSQARKALTPFNQVLAAW